MAGKILRRRARILVLPLLVGLLATAAAPGVIRIKGGDTLWRLARAHGTSAAALKRANGLTSDRVHAGQVLKLPGNNPPPVPAAVPVALPAPRRYPPEVVAAAAAHRAQLAARPHPSRAATRRLVADTAARLGVDRALALAIAQQESGFQQWVVSDADAIGTMQVLPSTGRAMSRLAGRPLDLLSPGDNVVAGVTLLKALTAQAPIETAIAGYYQGLSSVRKKGMYPDTRRYVANVLAIRKRYGGT